MPGPRRPFRVSLLAGAVLLAACPAAPRMKPAVRESPGPEGADARLLAALRSTAPVDPVLLGGDPYRAWQGRSPEPPPSGTVCGVRFEADLVHYRLATFAAGSEARAAGFAVTHTGPCGTCSTMQDLAVYLEKPDLTAPVRHCGALLRDHRSLACIEKLGFSAPCALTWFYNARNTRRECLGVCLRSWIEREPDTRDDGSLNACLRCDEDRSGPVFKATAGRTRRNSGIRSSIPRPDEEIAAVTHEYVPDRAAR